jgi:uncharacterized tellurite resistance protein B-like protein
MTLNAFFDEISGGMTREEAFMALLLASVWIDRNEDPREVEEKRALEKRTRTLSGVPEKQIADMKDRLRTRLTPERIDHLIEDACDSLTSEKPDVRMSIFGHCVDVVFADRRFDKLEKKYLTTLIERLKIDHQDATAMISVLRDKNNLR